MAVIRPAGTPKDPVVLDPHQTIIAMKWGGPLALLEVTFVPGWTNYGAQYQDPKDLTWRGPDQANFYEIGDEVLKADFTGPPQGHLLSGFGTINLDEFVEVDPGAPPHWVVYGTYLTLAQAEAAQLVAAQLGYPTQIVQRLNEFLWDVSIFVPSVAISANTHTLQNIIDFGATHTVRVSGSLFETPFSFDTRIRLRTGLRYMVAATDPTQVKATRFVAPTGTATLDTTLDVPMVQTGVVCSLNSRGFIL